jgi:hypothetical protein
MRFAQRREDSQRRKGELPATVMPSPASLSVHVIGRATGRPRACANERAFPSTDQAARARPNRGADADTLRGFAFACFRIVPATVPVCVCRWSERRDQHEHREN